MKKVCMLGSGAFGTAMSALLADNGFEVNLWCHDPCVADVIARKHCNEIYLPDTKLSEKIRPFANIKYALEGITWIFEATPVAFLRSVLERAKPFVTENQPWVILSKGIENKTLLFPSQMVDDVFGRKIKKGVVSGPSFAKNIILKQVTGVDVASDDMLFAQELKKMLDNNYFRCQILSDVLGTQVGGALKNVVAIGVGMLDGAGYTDNTKSFLLTESLSEMALFAENIGADPYTLYGLSGVGDLVLTCMGGLSRNLMVGRHLGLGEKLDDILEKMTAIPEGINTAKSVCQMIKRKNKDMSVPLFEFIYEIICGNRRVSDLVEVLKAMPILSNDKK